MRQREPRGCLIHPFICSFKLLKAGKSTRLYKEVPYPLCEKMEKKKDRATCQPNTIRCMFGSQGEAQQIQSMQIQLHQHTPTEKRTRSTQPSHPNRKTDATLFFNPFQNHNQWTRTPPTLPSNNPLPLPLHNQEPHKEPLQVPPTPARPQPSPSPPQSQRLPAYPPPRRRRPTPPALLLLLLPHRPLPPRGNSRQRHLRCCSPCCRRPRASHRARWMRNGCSKP